MTDLLYMNSVQDCYMKDFEAKVLSVIDDEEKIVILDRTAFYPLGGGQPNDTGTLRWKGGSCRVVDVRKKNKVLHVIEGDLPKVGQDVVGDIGWSLRYEHMRMHTAQHLVSAIIWRRYKAATVGNQIHADYSHIDFEPADFSFEELKIVEKEINELISNGARVFIENISRKTIEEKLEKERVDLSRLPVFIQDLRTVFIEGKEMYDMCPCAGTHVKDISELKGIEIIKRKSKGSGKIRVQYRLL